MALAQSDLQALRDSLVEALGSGALRTRDANGRETTWASRDEMIQRIADLDRMLGAKVSGGLRVTPILYRSGNGA